MAGGLGLSTMAPWGAQETKAWDLLDVQGIVRHGEPRTVRLVGGDDQEVGGDRIGSFLALGVVRHEPPVIRLRIADEEGLPLPPRQRGEAEVGGAGDHTKAARPP